MKQIGARLDHLWSYASARPAILAAAVFSGSLMLYLYTLAPGLLWGGGDFATFQTRLYTGEISSDIFGHPLWVIVAHPFLWLPLRDAAYRANLASAFFASLALTFVFLSAWRLTRVSGAALLATAALAVAHTFWTYAVMPKPYSLNALLLSACLYFLLRWSEEKRGLHLAIFAALYGISPINHLVMLTAAAGFLVFVFWTARRRWNDRSLRAQLLVAAAIYLACTCIYLSLVSRGGQAQSTGETIAGFLNGFVTALRTPTFFFFGLAIGIALWFYQFAATIPFGMIGFVRSWRGDPATAVMLALIALGDVAFLLGATDPRTGGEYVWNLHYYLLAYIVFALWIAQGFAARWNDLTRTGWRKIATIFLTLGLPILIYATAPTLARPLVANLPGFRDIGGRDNLTYVLSPWKQGETGARIYGESILNALPANAIFFSDYSIWSVVNYLEVVEGARRDVQLVELPGSGSGQQLPLLLNHRDSGDLFLGDVNRYYDMNEIENYFLVVASGPINHLIPK